jgi:hypothetical protein
MILLIICGIFMLMLFALIFVFISTERHEGKWGINTADVSCPRCGLRMPKIRKPQNLRQCLWGGGTCQGCGCEVDKWGKEVEQGR